ncbi:MAG: SGNH/GDSL hydrolase family protein [Sedimentisphaerales bacterium]|nr:SGNH/GDSL hydrolase family protein [Sedimentisphaerales bacterium]
MSIANSKNNHTTRRNFLKQTAAATAAGLMASSILSSAGCCESIMSSCGPTACRLTDKNNVILFQGDSITDLGRDRRRQDYANDLRGLGTGYVLLAASQLLDEYSDLEPKIYNRGISGNKVFQLSERWDADCIALKPGIVSILVGVNDYWHISKHGYEGTIETYEKDYHALLQRTRKELPEVTLVVCEPFVLRCGVVENTWFPDFDGYRTAAKKVAAECKAIFVPFQSVFDKATKKAPVQYWAADGVHPTLAGAHLMAQAWLKAVFG